eukprot:gene17447-26817_t
MRASTSYLLCALAAAWFASADEASHVYKDGEDVWVWANKIGPFNNPLETYGFFDVLPLCKPQSTTPRKPSLGEALAGDELIKLDVDLKFKVDVDRATICTKKLTASEAKALESAVTDQYWYQLYIDDLPTWAALGRDTKEGGPMVYTHQRFSLGFNGNQIVIANLTAAVKVPVPVGGGELTFTYSVEWHECAVEFSQRFRRYLDERFFENKIHWVAVLNSLLMLFVLACFVMIVLLRMRADCARYEKELDDEGVEFRDESGWKLIHREVFRVPPNHVLLCALVGTGYQLIVLCFGLIFIAIASVVYADRGGLATYAVVTYAITSAVAGYASGKQFVQYAAAGPAISKDWIKTMLYTACLLPFTVSAVLLFLNFVAHYYNSQQVIPVYTIFVMILIWFFVSLPLVVIGTLMGRHQKREEVP